MSHAVSRRDFLKTSSVAAGATGALSAAALRAQGANERIRIGMIGVGGRGFGVHLKSLAQLENEGANIQVAAVADVYSVRRDRAAEFVKTETGNEPARYVDYREMIEKEDLDAVSIATPDHWHHRQIVDALNSGLHVYCEKPMTKTVEEALDVVRVAAKSGKVMQVGVQTSSHPIWDHARELMNNGKLGKVLMYQTEYFRNSAMGQWRYYRLEKQMTPQTIDWKRWLGVEEGLADERPFDREVYAQWRRFWPYGSGMFTDLFVHKVTCLLKATGLRYPARVVGAGGIFLEYDGRDVPDVATVVADYGEGVQGLVSSTMCCEETRLESCIRGHFGSFRIRGTSMTFVPERPQVTRNSQLKEERIRVDSPGDLNVGHFRNWIAAIQAGDPRMCSNPPDLGAAAVTAVILGAQSYRNGVVYYFDPKTGPVHAHESPNGGASWASQWEKLSQQRGSARHIPGWQAGDYGSTLEEPAYMSLAGPWVNGQPPETT